MLPIGVVSSGNW